ncbi:retropepsin-like aspartic protease [Edaphobacter aggregans]|uniref:retropepsin-like aspartic protease n=1 Tax=Edaphobacter aggregans TaxID=570835 RepID=UPI00055886CA|nr:retropepsin-like aspartic protease [Edaphobacter aggregans]
MIIVPLTINGMGPFDFLLDTGSTRTVLDQKLAEELHLEPAGRATLESPDGAAVTTVAHTDSVSMGGATVRNLNMVVMSHYDLLPKVRGILGEDFLRYFDILIDNRRHLIQFERGPGPLGVMLSGEHLPLSVYGSDGEKLTSDRLVVMGQLREFYEFGHKDAKLQLDSGTPHLLLCSQVGRAGVWQNSAAFEGIHGNNFAADAQKALLRLGHRLFKVTVVVPAQNIPSFGVDGFLPTSLFSSIFISHSGRFVILDPSAKPKLAQSKPPFRTDTAIPDGTSLLIPSRTPE